MPATPRTARPAWPGSLVGFAILFIVYQAAEALQTIYAKGSLLGPALMALALLLAWPVGRRLGGTGYGTFGLSASRTAMKVLAGGLMLAALAKLAALSGGLAAGAYAPAAAVPSGLTATAVVLAVLTTFVPSIAEDILTRGFLLRVFPLRLGAFGYVAGSAALYTANHIWRFDWGVSEQVRLFCLGLA